MTECARLLVREVECILPRNERKRALGGVLHLPSASHALLPIRVYLSESTYPSLPIRVNRRRSPLAFLRLLYAPASPLPLYPLMPHPSPASVLPPLPGPPALPRVVSPMPYFNPPYLPASPSLLRTSISPRLRSSISPRPRSDRPLHYFRLLLAISAPVSYIILLLAKPSP